MSESFKLTNKNRELSERVIDAANSSRQINKMSSSLAKLRLSNMKLHGRESDMKVLKGKLMELKEGTLDNKNNISREICLLPEMVLISGVSGTGKSSLVMKGLRDPAARMGMNFVGGKFDLNHQTSLPLSAFVDVMASLTNIISGGDMMQYIQDDTSAFEEEDRILLVRALPGCEKLFNSVDNKSGRKRKSKRESLLAGKEIVARLQYAIRRLLKIICTHLKGLVLFIDDLQWSDVATLDLLKNISLDSDIPCLLLVGAYREDEVPDTHPLAIQIRDKEQIGMQLTKIKIENLTLDNVISLTSEALGMEDNEESVTSLATIVHRKTEGNAFFVLLFLRSLHEEKLLVYNFGIMKWTWNDNAVDAKLATENVTTMLINKLGRLNSRTRNIVKVASCLGAKFSLSTVSTISDTLSEAEMRSLSSEGTIEIEIDNEDDETLASSINELEEEGIWEKESDDLWCFGHDKIQSAAMELIAKDKRDAFRGTIGSLLLKKLDHEAVESNLFEVVSLRNCAMATISDEEERKELASMNLRAGIKASENAVFESAAAYLKAGRELLGSSGWVIDPSIMLELCSVGANSCFICGDLSTMNQFIDEVMRQDIPVEDKFRVYEVKVKAAYGASEFNVAIDTAFDYSHQLGLPTPKNKPAGTILIIKEFIKTNRALGNKTAEDIANLPDLTDERIVMGQRMLELSTFSSFQAQPTIYPLIVFHLVRATLKYGINSSSCDGFSGFALLLCGFGKYQKRIEISKVVDLILAKPDMDHIKSRCMMLREGTIHHWIAPVQDTLAPLLEGYQIGLRTGDNENAASNLIIRVFHLYYAGRPLKGLGHEMQTIINSMIQLNQSQAKLLSLPYLLIVKTLADAITEDNELSLVDIRKLAEETGNITLRAQSIMAMLELNVFFQKWEEAAFLLTEAGDLGSVLMGFFAMTRFTYLEGLISSKAAQAASTWMNKRKWKKKALKAAKLIEKWVKLGNGNVLHSLHLLQAECAALTGKHKATEVSFKAAIKVASRNGFLHDLALSHEMASAYYLGKGDDYWQDYHMGRCIESYSEYGATAKVKQLNK